MRHKIAALILSAALFVSGNAAFAGSYGFNQFAEDAAHTSGDIGNQVLGVRADDHQAALSGTNGDYTPASVSAAGHVRVDIQAPHSYQCTTGTFTAAASATDMASIYGSSSRTIRVQRVYATYSVATASAVAPNRFHLAKRTAADTGGTSVGDTEIACDSSNTAVTATVLHYTANPTNGAGTDIDIVAINPVNSSATVNSNVYGGRQVIYEEPAKGQGIVLRGTSEGLAIHNNATTVVGTTPTVCFTFQWTEE